MYPARRLLYRILAAFKILIPRGTKHFDPRGKNQAPLAS
jgi:hypothetical protein